LVPAKVKLIPTANLRPFDSNTISDGALRKTRLSKHALSEPAGTVTSSTG
jgi:hypothetical protein